MKRIFAFSKMLFEDIEGSGADKIYQWMKSYQDSEKYLTFHRDLVKAVGKLLGIDMEDHDVTKSRIVQIALGFLWHWPGKREDNEQMKKLALDTVHAGHLEIENHHPEHEKERVGCVDIYKVFTYRLSVHLLKDTRDDQKGWGINMNFIPVQYRAEWESFHKQHKNTNLYDAWEEVVFNEWKRERLGWLQNPQEV